MKVIKIKDIEDCFDGTFIKEAMLDCSITKEFIYYLGQEGILEYFSTFARPFFKIDIANKYILKGVEGNKTIRIIFCIDNMKTSEKKLISVINNYL